MNISERKKILVCEFITGGGLAAEAPPESLVKEGTLMRDALLKDLSALDQYEIITMQDARLNSNPLASSLLVESASFKQVFAEALSQVDLVWIIAPETGGTLLELSEICYEAEKCEHGPIFIGSGFDTMLTGTSKTLCFEALRAAKIHTLDVHAGEDLMQAAYFSAVQNQAISLWVAKPEDGAGCEGIRLFSSLAALRDWLAADARYLDYLAQPYQQGVAASFSMLCRNGKAWVLSCNQQHMQCNDEHFKLKGIAVNGMAQYRQQFETIARKIAQMLPDALGYIGVDVIVDTEHHRIYVLEINPRLTTSYVGLHAALNANPAKLILDCALNDQFTMPAFSKNGLAQNIVQVAL
jgi:predicted ATP-grasp superfamily ATP-dependent carboligase